MIDPTKPIKASDLLLEVDALHEFPQNYILLSDSSIGGTYLKFIEVVNVLDQHGWEIVGISQAADGMTMYGLARRITKVKNQL
ncbi:MAG: hypothetical protein U0694_17020 [Anaerolineae bacterium]